jgi:hypothetical protein
MKRAGAQLGAIALLAILVRALVPAGYMLAEADTPDGRYLVVQMCDGHDAAQVIDLDSGKLVEASELPEQTEASQAARLVSSPAPRRWARRLPSSSRSCFSAYSRPTSSPRSQSRRGEASQLRRHRRPGLHP